MKTGIIVLNYNTKDEVLECLRSIKELKQDKIKIKVYVVDNASRDGSPGAIRAKFPDFVLIENKKNLGFSAGNNVGIKRALEDGAEAVLILNPDTKIDSMALLELSQILKEDPKTGIFAPKIYFYPTFEFHREKYRDEEKGKVIWYAGGKIDWKNVLASHRGVDEVDHGQFDRVEETEFATGAAMYIKREVFDIIGFFNEDYFLYLEDLEFSIRAREAGFKIIFTPKALVWHKWAQATGGGSRLQDYFITRNRLLFGLKYAPLRAKIALSKEAIKFIFDGQTRRQAVFDFLTHNLGQGSFKA